MISRKHITVACLLLSVFEGTTAQEGPKPAGAEAFQQYQWPAITRADTSLAHSSASEGFRVNRRRLLASSRTSEQAEKGEGVIEYKPVGFNVDGDDFAVFFSRAYANKRATGIRLASGTYHVTHSVQNQAHLYMRCGATQRADRFEVDFSGVFFYFTDHKFTGASLYNCSNVDVHGPWEQTYTNDQLDYAQGTIVGVNEEKLEYTVQVDDGYPADRILLESGIATMLWNSTTLLLKPEPFTDLIDAGKEHRRKLGDRKYLIKTSAFTRNVTVGDLFSARGESGSVGLVFDHVRNCTARDLTIYHSGGFGVFVPFSHNCSFTNIQLRPFPLPLGRDGKLPLLSTAFDGFHITNAQGGATVKDCYIVNTGDDAIASSGSFYHVAAVYKSERAVVIAADNNEIPFEPGDLLNFYATDSERLATVRIAKLASVEVPSEAAGKTSKVAKDMKFDDADFMKVHLASWPPGMDRLKFDDVASSPSNNGNGFAFVNNTIGNLRGRGILSKSSNGVIAHNRLFNLKGFAIQMSPEYLWGQADFVNNVLVLNNTINSYGAGIWLGADPLPDGPPAPYTNNYNVDFINNTIANCATTPLLVTSAAGVTVINTTFVNVLCIETDTKNFGDWEVEGTLAMVANARDISFFGNSVIKDARCKHPRGNYDRPVAMVNATNVNGLVPWTPVDSLLQTETP